MPVIDGLNKGECSSIVCIDKCDFSESFHVYSHHPFLETSFPNSRLGDSGVYEPHYILKQCPLILIILASSCTKLRSISRPEMKISTLIAALTAISTVASHTVFITLFVNDVGQGDGTCVRMPMTPSNATFPINDLSSNDMACGMYNSPESADPRF